MMFSRRAFAFLALAIANCLAVWAVIKAEVLPPELNALLVCLTMLAWHIDWERLLYKSKRNSDIHERTLNK